MVVDVLLSPVFDSDVAQLERDLLVQQDGSKIKEYKYLQSVPLSMMSTLVSTPIVLCPYGSMSLANFSPSLVEMSALAGITHRIMLLSSFIYLIAMLIVTFSMSSF